MSPKTAKILTWAILIFGPILPAFLVIGVIHLKLIEAIAIFLLEYFAFQYVMALFIKKFAERIQYKQQKEESMSQGSSEVKIQ